MKVLILNGSPRPNGNTKALVDALKEGAVSKGHEVTEVDVARLDLHGCLGCEYCHTKGRGKCVQNDDMQKIYPLLQQADALVLALPIYYHGFSGQLKCAIDRFYAIGAPGQLKLRKIAMLLSSGADQVYEAAFYSYHKNFIEYMGLEDAGIITAHGSENKSEAKREEARMLGASL
ncbi:flavodoxin family protein [Catenisphaera adipataccumulans]|uniref:Multimeric flavodoxin WrbA n=1 Tax=Catenisphaera adipataccumulans TaxID=700500 RepID=A0A7W8FX62_9FIRM|nr:flavodoxin family protein [Catenisphaera adipataccumulans]MBB5182647.1 multimeric flavodoxin WrbA [Catenisphaera adipataccumulans]